MGGQRAISYTIDDLAVAEAAGKLFRQHLDHVESNSETIGRENPVGTALGFQQLIGTGDPRDAVLAQLLDEVRSLKGDFATIARAQPTTFTPNFTPIFPTTMSETTKKNLLDQLRPTYSPLATEWAKNWTAPTMTAETLESIRKVLSAYAPKPPAPTEDEPTGEDT